jgi:HK97 family phage major capsid protein
MSGPWRSSNGSARYAGLRSFKGATAERDAFRVGQFIRASMYGSHDAINWCKENGVVMTRAQSEGVNSAGGVLVPEEMMNAIIVLRETYGVFRKECRVVPMGRDTLNWPRRTGGLTAYFTAENATITDSSATFDNVNLTAKKLACLTKLSTEIAEDAIVAIADYVVGEISYAFASKEDDCGFNGDGTSTYGGMTGVTVKGIAAANAGSKYTAASGHNTFALLDGTDLTGAMGKLPQYALPNAKWYVSQVGFATTFERLVAAAGGNSIATLDGSISYRYLGYPIVISQKLPTSTSSITGQTMALFGDLSLAAAMGERRGVSIRRLDERFADADQIGIMGTERFDINVHDMGDATNAGPLVALVAP